MGQKKNSDIDLASLPILTRDDLRQQVASEGPLLRGADGLSIFRHATSGSSGVPVRFFVSDVNSNYNEMRSLAQFFLEGRDLSLNRTRIKSADAVMNDSISIENHDSWIVPALSSLIKSGKNKEIKYFTVSRKECHKLVQNATSSFRN